MRPGVGLPRQQPPRPPPVIEEPSLADPHATMSAARSGLQEIPARRDEQRPFFVDLSKYCGLVVDRFMPPTRQSGC